MKIEIMIKPRGITLIALIITIIVLLILAGVTVATLTGENGILTNVQKSKEMSIIGEEKERITLAYNAQKARILSEELGTNIEALDLEKEMNNDENRVKVKRREHINSYVYQYRSYLYNRSRRKY